MCYLCNTIVGFSHLLINLTNLLQDLLQLPDCRRSIFYAYKVRIKDDLDIYNHPKPLLDRRGLD